MINLSRLPEVEGPDAYVKLCNWVKDQEELQYYRQTAMRYGSLPSWQEISTLIFAGTFVSVLMMAIFGYALAKLFHLVP